MQRQAFILILVASSLLCFAGYFTAILDWIQDYQSKANTHNYLGTVGKTSALAAYTFYGTRFLLGKIKYPNH